jgi:hypothetical protein
MEMGSKQKALFSGVAGAMAIAGGTDAYGAVMSIPLPANIPGYSGTAVPFTQRFVDIDGNGTTDILFDYSAPNSYVGGTFLHDVTGIDGYGPGPSYANNLTAGTSINATDVTATPNADVTLTSTYGQVGAFLTNQTGFIGFSFVDSNSATHFGYFQVTTGQTAGLQFLSAAYQTTPNTAILAGATPVPEPGSLAALAFGAMAVASRRRPRALQ